MKQTYLIYGILAVITSIVIYFFLTGYTRSIDPTEKLVTAQKAIFSSKGWAFREEINFTSTRLIITGNVDLEHNILNTTMVKLENGFPSLTLTFANRTGTYANIEGGWIKIGEGWAPEQTILYKLFTLATESSSKTYRTYDTSTHIFFEDNCSSSCKDLFNTLESLASSKGVQPEKYIGIVRIEKEGVKTIYLEFLGGKTTICSLIYSIESIKS